MGKVTVPSVRARKVRAGAEPIVMVTAYDAPGARIAEEAGVDVILVGDSVAMVVLGHDSTLEVSVDEMVHHTAAVARAGTRCLVVADMPFHDGKGAGHALFRPWIRRPTRAPS